MVRRCHPIEHATRSGSRHDGRSPRYRGVAAVAGVLTACVMAVGETVTPAVNSMRVDPVAVANWSDLAGSGASTQRDASAVHRVVPLMLAPPPRYVGETLRGALSQRQLSFTAKRPILQDRKTMPAVATPAAIGKQLDGFLAIGDDGTRIPPDTNGAVGPDYVMTMLNTQVRVQDRAGNVPASDITLLDFWSPLNPVSVADPRLVFDPTTQRWYASVLANPRSTASAVLFAVSTTPDPTGDWVFYQVDADPTDLTWADFPDVGFSATWFAITSNMFSLAGNSFQGVHMWVFDKAAFVAGDPLDVTFFPRGFDTAGGAASFTLRPCRTFDPEPTLYLVDNSGFMDPLDDRQMIRLSQIVTAADGLPTWSVVAGSVISGSGLFRVPNGFHFGQIGAPQRASTSRVETNDPRVLSAVFRNGRAWCVHTAGLPATGAVTRTGVFWYQLDPLAMPDPVVQSGVLDEGAERHLFFPSLAVDVDDNVCIGLSRGDPTRFVEGAVACRRGTDPLGMFGPLRLVKSGEFAYRKDFNSGRIRWGDYSSTVVDPESAATFWTIQEYAAEPAGPAKNDERWGTWWANIADVSVSGACCDAGGACLGTVDQAACASLGGNLFPDEDCASFNCPIVSATCPSAVPIECNTSVTIDNRSMTNAAEPPFSCGINSLHDGAVWFSFTAATSTARFSTCRSVAQDSALAVYDGNCDALTEIACGEDDCGLKGFLSDVVVSDLTPGQTYYVQLAAWSPNDRGLFTLDVSCPACQPSDAPQGDPFLADAGFGEKNRYLSFSVGNPDRVVAVRLTFVSMPPGYEQFEGRSMWVTNPTVVTESPGSVSPLDAPGVDVFRLSGLICVPFYRDWSRLGVIHVTHALIVPGATYALDVVDQLCSVDAAAFSEPLWISTASRWGDLQARCEDHPCAPPDGRVDMATDIIGIIGKFVARPGAPIKSRADLAPAVPDRVIDILDLLRAVDAFVGVAYPFAAPDDPCG